MKDKKVNRINLSTYSFKIPEIKRLYIKPRRVTKQIRINYKLHQRIKEIAKEEEQTMSKFVDKLIEFSLNKFYKKQ